MSRISRHILRSSHKKKIEVQLPTLFLRFSTVFAQFRTVSHSFAQFRTVHRNSSAFQTSSALPFLIRAHFAPVLRWFIIPCSTSRSFFIFTKQNLKYPELFCQKTFYNFGKNILGQDSISRLGPVSFCAPNSFWVPSGVRRLSRRVSRISRLSYLQSTLRFIHPRLLVSFWPSEDFL